MQKSLIFRNQYIQFCPRLYVSITQSSFSHVKLKRLLAKKLDKKERKNKTSNWSRIHFYFSISEWMDYGRTDGWMDEWLTSTEVHFSKVFNWMCVTHKSTYRRKIQWSLVEDTASAGDCLPSLCRCQSLWDISKAWKEVNLPLNGVNSAKVTRPRTRTRWQNVIKIMNDKKLVLTRSRTPSLLILHFSQWKLCVHFMLIIIIITLSCSYTCTSLALHLLLSVCQFVGKQV